MVREVRREEFRSERLQEEESGSGSRRGHDKSCPYKRNPRASVKTGATGTTEMDTIGG